MDIGQSKDMKTTTVAFAPATSFQGTDLPASVLNASRSTAAGFGSAHARPNSTTAPTANATTTFRNRAIEICPASKECFVTPRLNRLSDKKGYRSYPFRVSTISRIVYPFRRGSGKWETK